MEFASLSVCAEVVLLVSVVSAVLNCVTDASKLPVEVTTDSALEPALLISGCDENSVIASLALAVVFISFVCVAVDSLLLLDVRMELAVLTKVLLSDTVVTLEFASLSVGAEAVFSVAVVSAVRSCVTDVSKLPVEVSTYCALVPALLISACDDNSGLDAAV